jgi:hypothetical protein
LQNWAIIWCRIEANPEEPMERRPSVEAMSDAQALATFGTGADATNCGFDEATHTRVMAAEMVRARQRLAHYRTLYAAFLEAGEPVMIENLDEAGQSAVPAKLVFTDTLPVQEGVDPAGVVVWTEATLLEALARERTIADFFTKLLDELEPVRQAP